MSIVNTRPLTQPAAAVLAGCALLSAVVILHHPTVRSASPQAVLTGITRLAAMDRAVHATLIAFVLLMVYAFCVYTYAHRGRLLLGFGALAVFIVGAGAVIGAGLIDGFFIPAFAGRYDAFAPSLQTSAIPMLTAAAIAIQVLTKFGFFAFAAAAVLWGIELIERGGASRVAGLVACAAAIAEFLLMATTGTLTPHNLPLIVLVQAVWCVAFAWRLWNVEDRTRPMQRSA